MNGQQDLGEIWTQTLKNGQNVANHFPGSVTFLLGRHIKHL